MNVDIICPQCGTLFTVRRELLGKRTKCTKCGNMFVIAEPPTGSAPHASEPPTLSSPPTPGPIRASQMPPAELPEIITTPRSAPVPPPTIDVQSTAQTTTAPFAPHEYSVARADADSPRFTILYVVARVYEVLAILALAAAALAVLWLLVSAITSPSTFLDALMPTGLTILCAITAAMMFLFMAQSIRLGLQVEQNTRETRRACERLADHLGGIEHEP